MNTRSTTTPLLTWLDVERTLKNATQSWETWPNDIQGVDCFADGLDVRYTESASPNVVHDWLKSLFGHAYDTEHGIKLRIGDSRYPVHLEPIERQPRPHPSITYPLWRDVAYFPTPIPDAEDREPPPLSGPPADLPDTPRLVSFHSFKGGVGRTTAMMTFVAACVDEQRRHPTRVLIVDADLEAPGVTFWLDDTNRPQVSFIQFLEAMHYPPADIDASLDFFAAELQKTSVSIAGNRHELFILPAASEWQALQDRPVQPQDLARNPDNPWILSDHLQALGRRLGVEAIFIDLRAGLSEISSPMLFDPRIEHYFATTIAAQSVQGLSEILRRLQAFNRRLANADQRRSLKPAIILSLLTQTLRKLPEYETAAIELAGAYPLIDRGAESIDTAVEWLEMDFAEDLMSIGSIDQALHLLKSSSLYRSAQAWVDEQLTDVSTEPPPDNLQTSRDAAQRLYDICEQAQYAEQETSTDMLVTEPLRNLGKHYVRELPNVLITGAKGSGKTFVYTQLVLAQRWSVFLKTLDSHHPTGPDAGVIPLLWSRNLSEDHKRRSTALQRVEMPFSQSDTRLKAALQEPRNDWDAFWEQALLEQLGDSAAGLSAANQSLIETDESVIFLFDGVEDVITDPFEQTAGPALAGLLKLLDRLSELDDRRIGLVILLREDYVRAVIKQNTSQFLARFSAFRLEWNPDSFLRLAYWLCGRADIIDARRSEAESQTIPELLIRLERLWGKKMGKPASKEAHSARWVYSALCDLRGHIQARDLVRFLRLAAREELGLQTRRWDDRVLSPESLRKALPEYSKEKVEDAKQEMEPLRTWLDDMNKHLSLEQRVMPFSLSDVSLTTSRLSQLKELGVIYEDHKPELGEKRLFLPEIYREGLSFVTSLSGRPRIQALLKKNVKLPF